MRSKKKSAKCKRYQRKQSIELDVISSIRGSMHQGNPMLLPAAGKQCVSNVLAYFLFCNIKPPTRYGTSDIDDILYQGSLLYNRISESIGMVNRFLLINELPKTIYINRSRYELLYLTDESLFGLICGDGLVNEPFYSLSDALHKSFDGYNHVFLTMVSYINNGSGSTIGLHKIEGIFYVFDSHSRDENGMVVDDGKSVLMTIDSIQNIVLYLRNLSKSMNLIEGTFELTQCVVKSSVIEHDCLEHKQYNITVSVPDPNALECSISRINPNKVINQNEICAEQPSTLNTDMRVKYKESKLLYMRKKRADLVYRETEKMKNHEYRKCKRLNLQVKIHERSFNTKMRKNKRLNTEVKEHEQRINTKMRKNKRLNTEVKEHEQRVNTKMRKSKRLNPEVKRHEQSADTKMRNYKRLNTEVKEHEQRVNTKMRKNKRLNTEVKEHEQRVNTKMRKNERLNPEVKRHEQSADTKMRNYKRLNPEVKEHEQRVNTKMRKNKRLNTEVKEHEQRVNTKRRKNKRLNPEVKRHEQSADTKMRNNKRLNPEVKEHEQRVNTKIRKMKRMNPMIKKAEQVKNSAAKRVKRLIPSARKSDQIVNARWKRQYRLISAIRDREQHADTLRRRMKRVNKEYRHIEQIVNSRLKANRRQQLLYKLSEQFSNTVSRRKRRFNINIRQREQVRDRQTRARYRILQVNRERDNGNKKNSRNKIRTLQTDDEINKFHDMVSKGPTCVCSSCDQLCYCKSVVNIRNVNYTIDQKYLQKSLPDTAQWLCHTCLRYIKKDRMPPCSIANGNSFPAIPDELIGLYPLEFRLVSPRLPFMQIRQAPRGKQLKLTGNIVNVPADVNLTVKTLPRSLNNEGTVKIKLKRRLNYEHHVDAANIRPTRIMEAAKWLTENCKLYQDEGIQVNANWNPSELVSINSTKNNSNDTISDSTILYATDSDSTIVYDADSDSTIVYNYNGTAIRYDSDSDSNSDTIDSNSDDWTEIQSKETSPGNHDTMLTAREFVEEEEYNTAFSVAPGEGNIPLSIFKDKYSEELAFPGIFCGQQRVANENRESKVYYSEVCKSEIRRSDRRVCKYIDNLFFKLKKLQMKSLFDQTHIVIRKYNYKNNMNLKAKDLKGDKLSDLVSHNDGYRMLKNVRGTPAYFEKMKKDIFAMIRQLGPATLFLSFSAAETRWLHLLRILGEILDHRVYTDNELSEMSWQDKCRLIQSDPVTCARHFDYQVQCLMNKLLLNGLQPLGKISDFFYRVEFQHRGSPHIHMLVWLKNAPSYATDEDATIAEFVDSIITCEKNEDHITSLQIHKHSMSCKRGKRSVCRFGFPKPPVKTTVLLRPFEFGSSEIDFEKHRINATLIHKQLTSLGEGSDKSIDSFLKELNITYEAYLLALRCTIKSPTIFLRRNLNEIRINNYNLLCLKAWWANMDIQYITNSYSCAVYISSYITKGQRGMSELMKAACDEAKSNNAGIREQVRAIGNKFLNNIEISAQEAVYLLLQIPLRKSSRSTIFINTSPPEERIRLLKPIMEIENMDDDETKLHYDDKISQYKRRTKNLSDVSLAGYFAFYNNCKINQSRKSRNKVSVDGYPNEILNDENAVNDDEDPQSTDLDVFVEKRRNRARILRCVRYNVDINSEDYFREKIMLYTSWRNEETDLLMGHTSYQSRYNSEKDSILEQQLIYEPSGNVIDIINNEDDDRDFTEIWNNIAPNTESENIPPQNIETMNETEKNSYNADIGIDLGIRSANETGNIVLQTELNDVEYRELMRSLNKKQQTFVSNTLNTLKQCSTAQIFRFLSGGAGVGKSHVIKALHQSLIKYYDNLAGCDFNKATVLLLAPTGKAAFNIGGNTIHNALHILPNQSLVWKPLSMDKLNTFRCKYQDLKIVVIDEISMVGNKLFIMYTNDYRKSLLDLYHLEVYQ